MTPATSRAVLSDLDWNDLRAFLALVRGGTLRRASARSGLSPATLSRKVDQLERALGEQLVERLPTGCTLTAFGARIHAQAEAMARIAGDIGRARARDDSDIVQGTVRINADEWVSLLLTRQLPGLHRQHPGLTVEVLTSHRPYSLVRGEADVVVRPFRPSAAELVSRSVGTLAFGLYGSVGYVQAQQAAITHRAWGALDYVGLDASRADFPAERWLRAFAEPALPWLRCSYALGIYDGILADAGLGVLAHFLTAGDERLQPVVSDIGELRQQQWIAFHSAVRDSPRIRAVTDFVVSVFSPD